MGTRSITIIKDATREICVIYRQFDGYLSGHGADLADFLRGKRVVNGYGGADQGAQVNGAGDLATRLITFLKGDHGQPGNLYLYPAGVRDCGEEYTYEISATEGVDIEIAVTSAYHQGPIYKGPVSGFNPSEIEESD